jgi:hypothetical protein
MEAYTREHRRSTMSFDFGYNLTGAEYRDVQYTRTGARYQPDYLRFSLETRSYEEGYLPDYADLQECSIRLSGKKIKGDGTPGLAESTERFYDYEKNVPDYVTAIIEEATAQLQAEARELHG